MEKVIIKAGDLSKFLRDNATAFRVLDTYGSKLSLEIDLGCADVSIDCPQGAKIEGQVILPLNDVKPPKRNANSVNK